MNAGGWLLWGGLAGLVSLGSQWWTVQRLHPARPTAGIAWLLAGLGLRWLVIIGLFSLGLGQGLGSLLLLLAGLWLARWLGLAWLALHSRATE